ncbi:hypothetical protein QWJ07_34895 [Frankia sp. RB7]|nr:hypothetical protein [Frankia sp. RB7]
MDWSTLRTDLASAFSDYSKALIGRARFIKLVLVIGGALAAAIALSIDIAHANKEVSPWTVVGLAGAILVALGSAFDALRERDASQALITASQALDAVHQRELELGQREIDINDLLNDSDYEKAITRGLHLYSSMDVMRGAIEQSLDLDDLQPQSIIQTCLSASSNSLLGAFDFSITDTWTICVYRATLESGSVLLRCIAHLRKIPCDLSEARSWPEGVGVAGFAYSMSKEIIINDMSAPEYATMFDLNSLKRDYDKARYASLVAVPINIGNNPKPWGVAVATCDQAGHFSSEPSYGVATTEPARALAAMSALAAKAAEAGSRRSSEVAGVASKG